MSRLKSPDPTPPDRPTNAPGFGPRPTLAPQPVGYQSDLGWDAVSQPTGRDYGTTAPGPQNYSVNTDTISLQDPNQWVSNTQPAAAAPPRRPPAPVSMDYGSFSRSATSQPQYSQGQQPQGQQPEYAQPLNANLYDQRQTLPQLPPQPVAYPAQQPIEYAQPRAPVNPFMSMMQPVPVEPSAFPTLPPAPPQPQVIDYAQVQVNDPLPKDPPTRAQPAFNPFLPLLQPVPVESSAFPALPLAPLPQVIDFSLVNNPLPKEPPIEVQPVYKSVDETRQEDGADDLLEPHHVSRRRSVFISSHISLGCPAWQCSVK